MSDKTDFTRRFPGIRRLALNSPRRRIALVRQLAHADCGAATLAMVLAYHGKEVPLAEVRKVLQVSRDGANAAAILRAGRAYGLSGRGVRVEVEDIHHLPVGAILYWEFRHFVVLARVAKNAIGVMDPASGHRKIPLDQFRRKFTGVALIFEPTEAFERGQPKRKRLAGLFRLVLQRRDLICRLISISVLLQLLSAVMPILTGVMLDRVLPYKDYSLLTLITAAFCVMQAVNLLAAFVRSHLMLHLRTQLEVRFTLRFLDHLVDLPYSFFQQHTSGDLMVRLGSNNVVRDLLTSTVMSAFLDGIMAALYLVLLLLISLPMTLIVTGMAMARFALLAAIRWKQRQFLAESLENSARSQTTQVEMLSGMETLKSMGLEHRAAENWTNVFVDGLNISIRRGRLDAVFSAILGLLGILSGVVLMFYGTYMVLQGTWSLGTMMAFSAIAGGFLGPLNNLVTGATQLQMMEVYLERLNDVLDAPREQDGADVRLSGPLGGSVELEKVSFSYGSEDRLVVEGASVQILPGSRVALVGRTGSGKSTLARLIAGLYDPTGGRILFDGADLKTLDRRSVRCQLGIVTQETQLFGGSIRRNIALSNPQMDLDTVVRAARLACIHDEIAAMPMGYETTLADRGLSLSGGQRQRLALARALAGDPRILVLDEATSHLDAVTEQSVNRNLAALRCTCIVIAHRLSTIRDADMILVMERGKIVERGGHHVLTAAGGVYAELLEAQTEGNH